MAMDENFSDLHLFKDCKEYFQSNFEATCSEPRGIFEICWPDISLKKHTGICTFQKFEARLAETIEFFKEKHSGEQE